MRKLRDATDGAVDLIYDSTASDTVCMTVICRVNGTMTGQASNATTGPPS
jgi:hypothetical protein